jgi:hypothetical protein
MKQELEVVGFSTPTKQGVERYPFSEKKHQQEPTRNVRTLPEISFVSGYDDQGQEIRASIRVRPKDKVLEELEQESSTF